MLRESAAAISLAEAERLADAPVVFVGGTFNWAPTRDDSDNPCHNDNFNRINGGVAIGLQWDDQPARSQAAVDAARTREAEVQSLKAFAATGIPLEVYRAHQSLVQQAELATLTKRSVKAARRWMTFSANAYQAGTGEARDVLEGLVALLGAKRTYYQHLRGYHDARADLARATGHFQPGDADHD